jgi:hypothetical protein
VLLPKFDGDFNLIKDNLNNKGELLKRPRICVAPDPTEWITVRQASDLTGFSYTYTRTKLLYRDDAPAAICYQGRLYLRKAEVLSKWGKDTYATADEAISRLIDA